MILHIYKITNSINNKCYIGKTKNLNKRFLTHIRGGYNKSLISRAIQKYGKENFVFESIFQSFNEEEINRVELDYINKFNSLSPNGYNLIHKSDSKIIHSEESKFKMGKNRQGRRFNMVQKEREGLFLGVSNYVCSNGKVTYSCMIRANSKLIRRTFASEKEAAEAYDKIYLYIYGEYTKLNFPEKIQEYLSLNLKEFYENFLKREKSSKYIGVFWFKRTKQWVAQITKRPDTGKSFSLGSFETEIQAAEMRDKAIIFWKIKSKLNFPNKLNLYLKEDFSIILDQLEQKRKYEGVVFDSIKKNWKAVVKIGEKVKLIGRFKNKEEALQERQQYLKNFANNSGNQTEITNE